MWQMHTKILYSTDNSDDTQTNICTNMHSKRTEKDTASAKKIHIHVYANHRVNADTTPGSRFHKSIIMLQLVKLLKQ